MKTKKQVIDRITRVVISRFNLALRPEELSADQSLIELGVGVDSVSTLEFIMELEDELGVSIDESEVSYEVLNTIDDLSEFILSIK